jgi:hypothetical protein
MTDPVLVAIPLIVLATVSLLAFTGCALDREGAAPPVGEQEPPPETELPTAVTGDPSEIGSTEATLTGTVNPNGQPTEYHFEYGKTQSYGTTTQGGSAGSGTGDLAVDELITNLDFGSEYHYRIVAQSGGPPVAGSDVQFTTLPSTKYRDAVLDTPGLLSYWRLDETSGAKALHSGPQGNDGDYVGGFTLDQPGALNGDPDAAVLFNGTDAEMTSNGPVLSGACSIEGWFHWTGGKGLLSDDVTGGGGWRFAYDNNGSLAYRFAGTTFTTAVPTASVQNDWHHFVATKDAAGNVAFYVDGQPIHTDVGAGDIAAQMPWHLMRDRPSGQYTAGMADEVAMYDVALPASTVLDHFNFAKSG